MDPLQHSEGNILKNSVHQLDLMENDDKGHDLTEFLKLVVSRSIPARTPQPTQQSQQTPQPMMTEPAQSYPTPVVNEQKEVSALAMCRIGQETVHDILSRWQDVFSILKTPSCPNAISGPMDKRQKVQDQIRNIRLLFKRLRLVYVKCDMIYESTWDIESLIPFVGDEPKPDISTKSEDYQRASMENQELTEILAQKNQQLKEIIDNLRNIVWEITSMLAARKG